MNSAPTKKKTAKPTKTKSRYGVRHTQILMMFACWTIAFALRSNLSIAIVAMTTKSSSDARVFPWSEKIKGSLLSSFFWGYPMLQVLAGHLAERYGGKYTVAVGMSVCAISTLLTPLAAYYFDHVGVHIARIIQGAAQGCLLPSLYTLVSKWVTPEERNHAFTVTLTGGSVGGLIMLPVAGLLSSSAGGWPLVFYIPGIIALMWVLVWLVVGASTPAKHRWITPKEQNYIELSLANYTADSTKNLKTPWKQIFRSKPMWAIIVSHLGENWGYWTMVTQTPNYISSVLGFNISSNGFLSALPLLAALICAYIYSFITQYLLKYNIFSRTVRRKIWNSVALYGSGSVLLVLALYNSVTPFFAIVLLIAAMALNTAEYGGFLTNHVELSPNYCGTLLGITNSISILTSVSGPLCVGFIVHDKKSESQWRLVFFISSMVFMFANTVYLLFASSEIQPWNDHFPDSDTEQKKQSNIKPMPISEYHD